MKLAEKYKRYLKEQWSSYYEDFYDIEWHEERGDATIWVTDKITDEIIWEADTQEIIENQEYGGFWEWEDNHSLFKYLFKDLKLKNPYPLEGYTTKITYQTVSEESAAIGDISDHGWVDEGTQQDGPEDVIDELGMYGFSRIDTDRGELHLYENDPEISHSTGEETTNDAWIERNDGKPFTKDEILYFKRELGIR